MSEGESGRESGLEAGIESEAKAEPESETKTEPEAKSEIEAEPESEIEAEPEPLPIVFRDEHFVAIAKPAGLLIHRSSIARENDGGRYALQLLRDQIGARVYPVHRLDRPTSGLVIFGLSSEAARRLAPLFAQRLIAKRYLAVVRGYAPEHVHIDYAVAAHEGKNAPLKAAASELRCLATVELPIPVSRYRAARYSLVELRPHSGRWHQLRRHCAHLRYPIVGDTSHGDGAHNRLFREHLDCHRMLLVATAIALRHPFSGEPLQLEIDPEPGLVKLFRRFGWDWPSLPELIVEPAVT